MTITQRLSAERAAETPPGAGKLDPIVAEIVRHGLLSIPNQIDVNITRTAFSPLIYEYKDYAVGIVDAEGRLISQSNGGIPIFVANALGIAVRDGLEVHGRDGIKPGDVIISNHAATLGQHLNNVVMYTPIYSGKNADVLFGFMCVLVHWIDVGGIAVGSCLSSSTTDIFQEGVQYRSVKLWNRGEPQKDIYRIIAVNTRFPHMALGDLESQLAACLLGKDKIVALLEKYGVDTVTQAVEIMWEKAEFAAREAIRAIPDGVYSAGSFLDNDGVDFDKPIPIKVVIKVAGDEMTVDFSGVGDQVKGPLNSGRNGGAIVAARIAFKYIATPHEPANDGGFRPLKVVIPDGKFLSAINNAPLGLYSSSLPTVVDTIIRAMVDVIPDRLAAGHHGTMGIHAIHGNLPNGQGLFQNLETTHGGWGASSSHDGPGPFKTMNHGDTRDVPIEAQEALYPIRVEYVRFRADSGGPGTFRGGLGLEKLVTATLPCSIQTAVERTGCPAWGVAGGRDGRPPQTYLVRPGEPLVSILKGEHELRAGDQVLSLSGGGGGFGAPHDRDPAAVQADVRRGFVSRDAAAEDYGVILDEQCEILVAETLERRRRKEAS